MNCGQGLQTLIVSFVSMISSPGIEPYTCYILNNRYEAIVLGAYRTDTYYDNPKIVGEAYQLDLEGYL